MRFACVASLAAAAAAANPENSIIHPGIPWADTQGNRIYAGGGGFWQENGTYWWVGEGNKGINGCSDCSSCFNLYSSPDLSQWTNQGCVLANQNIVAPVPGPYRMERPKIFKCPANGKYTMWFHCDTPSFTMTSVGVLQADNIKGPYTFASPCFRPDGLNSYDMGVYQDDTGSYLVRSVMNQYAGISKMNDDCTNVTGIISQGPKIEGQAIFRYEDSYMLWGSHLTGWAPNPAILSQSNADSLNQATWTQLGNPSNDSTTWNSQSTFILPYTHPDGHVTYIYMGDRWNEAGKGSLQNATYIWLPLLPPSAANGQQWSMPWQDAWRIGDF